MARRCICDHVEALLEARPWFKALDAGAKWLCFQLVKILAAPSSEGRIHFSDAERVSLLVSMRVSEVETHLETLLQTGLLARGEDGALTCPALAEVSARTVAARRNGAAGGRPRKGETPEQMHQRRQRELMLPIAGRPAGKPTETQRWETASAGAAARFPTTTSSSSSQNSDSVAREASGDWVQLAKDAIEAGGLTHSRLTFEQAKVWLGKGAELGKSEAEVRPVVLGVVRRIMANPSTPPITSLRYFTNAIIRVLQGEEQLNDPAEAVTPPDLADFEKGVDAWIAGGCRGPRPEWRRVA